MIWFCKSTSNGSRWKLHKAFVRLSTHIYFRHQGCQTRSQQAAIKKTNEQFNEFPAQLIRKITFKQTHAALNLGFKTVSENRNSTDSRVKWLENNYVCLQFVLFKYVTYQTHKYRQKLYIMQNSWTCKLNVNKVDVQLH